MDAAVDSARPPLGPRALPAWLWRLIKDVVNEYRNDGVGDLAAAITFWTLLSIPAAVLALVSTLSSLESVVGASLAGRVESEVQQFVTDTFADSAALSDTVNELFNERSTGVATAATLAAVFTLSRAFAGLIRALDVAYEVADGRPFWYVRIVAIGLGLGTIVVVAAGATVLAVLPEISYLSSLRWLLAPGAFLVLVLWAATLFHVGPNHTTPWRWDLPGAVVTATGWVVATQGYAFYVRISADGNELQTTVGGIVLALTLMYLLSVVMLVGAELNDVLARRAGVIQQARPIKRRARRWWQRLRDMVTSEPHEGEAREHDEPRRGQRE